MQGQSVERRVTDGTAAALGALSLSSWIIGASAAALPRGRFVSSWPLGRAPAAASKTSPWCISLCTSRAVVASAGMAGLARARIAFSAGSPLGCCCGHGAGTQRAPGSWLARRSDGAGAAMRWSARLSIGQFAQPRACTTRLAGDRPAHGAVDAFPIGLLLLHAVRSPAPCRAARPQCSRVDPLGARLVAPLPRCLVGLRLLFPYDLSCWRSGSVPRS